MSALAELLPDLTLELAPATVIELPPVDVVPDSVRPALERYAVDVSPLSRAQLVSAVDRAGHRWEYAIASRAAAARSELVDACRRATALHDELVRLHATERWLRSFPWHSSWDLEPYGVYVPGRQVLAVPDLLGAIEDACTVSERLYRLARQFPLTF